MGAAFAHNFSLASSGAGPSPFVAGAFVVGMAFCLAAGFFLRERID